MCPASVLLLNVAALPMTVPAIHAALRCSLHVDDLSGTTGQPIVAE